LRRRQKINNQLSKSKQMVAKRMGEVWRQPPENDKGASTLMAMAVTAAAAVAAEAMAERDCNGSGDCDGSGDGGGCCDMRWLR